jgi:hypothetical protein
LLAVIISLIYFCPHLSYPGRSQYWVVWLRSSLPVGLPWITETMETSS